jgi:hypothetical protein
MASAHYAIQPVVTQRDIVETQYRTEAVNQVVPTTAYETVTVDEGTYQTVYVPRLVTKQVARTVYQNRTTYRTVPYQVTRRVSEYATQTVPIQTVALPPVTLSASIVPGASYATGAPTAVLEQRTYNVATPWTAVPMAAAAAPPTPIAPRVATPATGNGLAPVPDPRFGQRAAAPTPAYQGASIDPFGVQEWARDPLPATRQADRSASQFVPAPSAAAVWRAHDTLVR